MTKTFEASQADVDIRALVDRENQDVLIQLIGGDVPHYGVVTTVDSTGQVSTTALPSRPGHVHQEGVLTAAMADVIQPALQGNAVIVSGVHVNEIKSTQMQAISQLVSQLSGEIRDWLMANPRDKVIEKFAQ